MDIALFCHHKNMELVYVESRVTKPKTSFSLEKTMHNYLSTYGLKVCILLMEMPRTYQGW